MMARRRRWPIYFAIAAGYLFAAQTIAFAALAAAQAPQGGGPDAILCQNGRAPGEPQRHSDAAHCLVACAAFDAAAAPAPEFVLLPARRSSVIALPAATCAHCRAASARRTPHNPRAPPAA
ncbi:conserved hypothetical protein [Methylocella silvestris BL2]|uniref:DUF2946 domain-containing protein n=1 Tax=Methylocella silvestris (strain DSM 15510 / CIP 108128 / LMG 27833 / NCIMB 13906 / BL2) TaxID=395965 RepID=B8ERI9_METSB|nr:hypothetical protein [Methylocella silvestris]ACK51041.1 conserved hypothetical protein [Methylocella silvestris BL2]